MGHTFSFTSYKQPEHWLCVRHGPQGRLRKKGSFLCRKHTAQVLCPHVARPTSCPPWPTSFRGFPKCPCMLFLDTLHSRGHTICSRLVSTLVCELLLVSTLVCKPGPDFTRVAPRTWRCLQVPHAQSALVTQCRGYTLWITEFTSKFLHLKIQGPCLHQNLYLLKENASGFLDLAGRRWLTYELKSLTPLLLRRDDSLWTVCEEICHQEADSSLLPPERWATTESLAHCSTHWRMPEVAQMPHDMLWKAEGKHFSTQRERTRG